MKCRYVMEVAEPRVECQSLPGVECRDGRYFWPIGTIEDHPKAYMLVRMGVAEPADEECERAARRTAEQRKRAQLHQRMVSRGIMPDDYERFINGEIEGYTIDGADIPGPNFVDREDDDDDDT